MTRILATAVALVAVVACGGSGGDDGAGGTSGDGGATSAGGSGAAGGAGGSSAGGSGGSSAGGSGGSSSSCPPECFAEVLCVRECGDEPMSNGCCPCPSGMMNAYSCPEDAGAGCGLVGTPCPGATTCGGDLTCQGSVCAPSLQCARPPGGVGCNTGQSCLTFSGSQSGICVTDAERTCICDGPGGSDFTCSG